MSTTNTSSVTTVTISAPIRMTFRLRRSASTPPGNDRINEGSSPAVAAAVTMFVLFVNSSATHPRNRMSIMCDMIDRTDEIQ